MTEKIATRGMIAAFGEHMRIYFPSLEKRRLSIEEPMSAASRYKAAYRYPEGVLQAAAF